MSMNIAELFRRTFKVWIEGQPRGEQSEIADTIGISRQYMSDFINGRKMLSEEKREALAALAGFTYVEFLRMGEDMFADEISWESHPYITFDYINKYRLEEIIKTIEATEAKSSVKLSPKEKAELIVDLYQNKLEEDQARKPEAEKAEESKKAEIFSIMKYRKAA